uniref:Uncharacterized protein n=1 Tax=Falco tinnunculus TaxID=100819 RepID=A0A8C4U5N6_FALTI
MKGLFKHPESTVSIQAADPRSGAGSIPEPAPGVCAGHISRSHVREVCSAEWKYCCKLPFWLANKGQECKFPFALHLKTALFIFLLTSAVTLNFSRRGCEG